MKVASLFLVLAAVVAAAPATVQPIARDNALDTVNGLVARTDAASISFEARGAITDLTGHLTKDVISAQVLPLLVGKPSSVVDQVLTLLDNTLEGLNLPADLPSLEANLGPALAAILGEEGLVSQILAAVQGLLKGLLGRRELSIRAVAGLPDLGSLPLFDVPVVGPLLQAVVTLLNNLLAGIRAGQTPTAADLNKLTTAVKAVTTAVKAGKLDTANPTALQATLGPVLTTVDGVLQTVSPGNKNPALQNAEAGVVGSVGNLVTTVGARQGLDTAVADLLKGLHLDGVLAGLVSTILGLGNGIVAPLLGTGASGNALTNLLGGLGVRL